jgi:hypothetical protein
VDVNLSDGKAHDLELYFLDWDSTARSEQVQISDASTGAVLDTETVSSFHSGVYDHWQVSGNILITITRLSGANAVLSGLFIDPTNSTSATFLEQDTRTEGNWIGTYGTQGSEVIGDATSLPSYATVAPSGQAGHIWTTSTTDPRALQQAGGTGRIAATWYSATSFTVDVNLSDGKTHDLELYFLDWESTARSEQVQISNAATGAVLNTETVSSFHSGVYDTWQISGNIVITITRLTGANAVLSGLFIDPTNSTSAKYLEQDTRTEGNWINTYGTQGSEVIGDATNLPSYATVTPSGQAGHIWTTRTTDPRALQQAGTGRIAATWYSDTRFTVDVNLSDGKTHDLELYFLDWDTTARSEQVQISNAATGAVLDTETVSSFHLGVYDNWLVSGNIVITITRLTGANAVLSGLFIDPTNPTSATFLKQDTTTKGNWINTYGTQGSEVIGDATNLPSYATVTPSGQAGHFWTTSTTDPRALQQAGTGRIAATWYSATSFTVDVNLSDGKTHDLELYFLDWESTARSEQVQISNASTGAVLDTETVSSFHSGVYDNWQVSGNIVITITRLSGANAVLSGLFLGAAINDNPGFAIGEAVPGDLTNPSVPACGTSDSSTPNPAGNRHNFAAIVPRIVSPIAGGSSHGSAIGPGATEIDLALEALTADASTHDLALEQVLNDAWGRRMSRHWKTSPRLASTHYLMPTIV